MIKNSGLGQLAEAAKELSNPAGAHYPVRRRGERRELRPNWTGIAWLEAQTLKHTKVIGTIPVYADDDNPVWYTHPAARLTDRISEGAPTHCTRPMIELIDDYSVHEFRMSGPQYGTNPCPDCDDWSRTARCTQHQERGHHSVTLEGLLRVHPVVRHPEPVREPVAHFATDADGVLIAQQGATPNALRDAIRDEARRQFPTIFFDHPA